MKVKCSKNNIKQLNESFSVDYRLVEIIRKYLDKGFKRGFIDKLSEDGYPIREPIVAMIASDGTPLRNMTDKQLYFLLQDRFQSMFSDSKKLNAILKRIIPDWFYKRTKHGLLSKNLLEATNAQDRLVAARANVNTSPTEKQIAAGNYSKGHVSIRGYRISIENPKGSYRKGVDSNGKEWKTKMKNDYGYFICTKGKDGDAIDVFIGNNLNSGRIFVIDQKINGNFDESKVMLGFDTEEQAKTAYLNNYGDDWRGFWKITCVNDKVFKKWLYDGHKQRLPFFKYVEIKQNKYKN